MSLIRHAIERARLLFALKAFLRHKITPEEGRATTRRLLRERDQAFVSTVARCIYDNPRNVYLRLLSHLGISLDDIRRDVAAIGVEATLEKLYEAGVYVTVEEFKGRAPIEREGLVIPAAEADFSNPLDGPGLQGATGGSSGAPARTQRTFGNIAADGVSEATLFDELGLLGNPWAVYWQGETYYPIRFAKLGKTLTHCFSTLDYSLKALGPRVYLREKLTRTILWLSGIPVKRPEYVPANNPMPIVRWLAAQKLKGRPAVLHTHGSSALRICVVARENGIDIAGMTISVSGEPLTPAKAQVVTNAGVTIWPKYAMMEAGVVARACLAPNEVDEVHVNTGNLAIIQRERQAPDGGVAGLFLTAVQPIYGQVMLNMELGDYATLSHRDCGCPSQQLGLTTHLSGIRSYAKLTSEGVTYLGGDLVTLLEETLPQRFGGQAGDYQLVEEEEAGVTRISIYVAPPVGEVDEASIVAAVLEALAAESFGERRRTGELWQGANVLRVVRKEPLWTGRAKMLLLHPLGVTQLQAGIKSETPGLPLHSLAASRREPTEPSSGPPRPET